MITIIIIFLFLYVVMIFVEDEEFVEIIFDVGWIRDGLSRMFCGVGWRGKDGRKLVGGIGRWIRVRGGMEGDVGLWVVVVELK